MEKMNQGQKNRETSIKCGNICCCMSYGKTKLDLWKWKYESHVQIFAIPWSVSHQAPLSMEFSRQEYWSGLPFPSPGDLPHPGIKSGSPKLQAVSFPSEPYSGGQVCSKESTKQLFRTRRIWKVFMEELQKINRIATIRVEKRAFEKQKNLLVKQSCLEFRGCSEWQVVTQRNNFF